jgi:hypothetical protein
VVEDLIRTGLVSETIASRASMVALNRAATHAPSRMARPPWRLAIRIGGSWRR